MAKVWLTPVIWPVTARSRVMLPKALPPLPVKVICTLGLLFCWNDWVELLTALPVMAGGSA